ncbi:MAG: glutathione binding-like protein [Chloroflexota bacterium]
MTKPLTLYSRATPNGQKVSIALEEMEIQYELHAVDLAGGEQLTDEYKKINPNGKIPAIVDPEGPDGEPINIFESGAILVYLAEKSGKFLSDDPRLRIETLQWLFFQMGGIGPMFGQFGHFYKFGKDNCDHPYPVERYTNESKRLLGVLEERLEGRAYLVGDEYSIADMATFPWLTAAIRFYEATEVLELDKRPNVMAWYERCTSRPAAIKGSQVGGF